ncbi:MAG TPA: MFS transporter [Planctomycetota bacterium]|nr:MFS transporter [Planctomycetota bacterium]
MTTDQAAATEFAFEEINLSHNRACNAIGEGLWGMLAGFTTTATVLPALLVKLHASDLEKGTLGGAELVGFMLPGLLGVYMLADLKQYKRPLVFYHLYICCPILALLGVVVQFAETLPNGLVRAAVVGGVTLFDVSIGFIAPTWFHWLAALFPIKHRGTSLSFAAGLSSISSAAAAFVASELIEGKYIGVLREHPLAYPLNFAVLFYAAAALGCISMISFWLVREPAVIPPSGVRKDWGDIRRKIGQSLADRNFRFFLIGRIAEYVAFTFLGFFTYYFLTPEGGNLTDGEVTLYGAIMPITAAIFALVLGQLGDRFGHKLGKVMGLGWMVMAFGLILFVNPATLSPSSTALWVLVTFALRGFFLGSMFSGFNFIFESCPHDSLAVHFTASSLVVSPFVMVAGLLAGEIIDRAGHLPLYWLGLATASFSLLWYVFAVRDPRTLPSRGANGTPSSSTMH